jgi:hypothetical protein
MGAEGGGDEIAEEARRLIKERQFNPQRFLAEIDKGWYTDVALRPPCRAARFVGSCAAGNAAGPQRGYPAQYRASIV